MASTDYATKKDVQEIVDKAVGKAVEDLGEVIATFATQVDKRFTGVEGRLTKLESDIDEVKERLDKLKESHRRYAN